MKKTTTILTTIIFTIIIATAINAETTPFDQCVQLLTGLGQPIETGTCYFTDNASIYTNQPMPHAGIGIYCTTINNSFIIGNTYSFNIDCYYLNTSGTASGSFTIDSCTENWIINTPYCQINNTYTKTYYDNNNCGTNSNLPIDNGTENSCDYCQPIISQNISSCNINGTQTITYTDENYYSCCLLTGFTEDCIINTYPYNETTTQNCNQYINEINCTADPKPVLNDKINLVCTMPDTQEYCCVVNTYQGTNLLATTPEYKEATNSIFTLSGQQETRTCFNPNQRLLNAYYTQKELRPDNLYMIEVLCTNNNTENIRYQTPIIPSYHTEDTLIYRLKWFGASPLTIIFSIIILIGIILGLILLIKKFTGR